MLGEIVEAAKYLAKELKQEAYGTFVVSRVGEKAAQMWIEGGGSITVDHETVDEIAANAGYEEHAASFGDGFFDELEEHAKKNGLQGPDWWQWRRS